MIKTLKSKRYLNMIFQKYTFVEKSLRENLNENKEFCFKKC